MARGDTLKLRAGPSPGNRVVAKLSNGTVMRNLGCKLASGQRWCQIARPNDAHAKGWVAGRYLRESTHQP